MGVLNQIRVALLVRIMVITMVEVVVVLIIITIMVRSQLEESGQRHVNILWLFPAFQIVPQVDNIYICL